MKKTAFLLFLSLLAIGRCVSAVYVDGRCAGSVHDGRSWATAFSTINAALASAEPDESVWVKAGTYPERLTITQNVKLYGGFQGCESSPSDRVPSAFPSVIDAAQSGRGIDVASNNTATIDGFSIVNGIGDDGAGIRVGTNAVVNVANCRIEHCKATGLGGGVYFGKYATMNGQEWGGIENCVIQYNEADSGGGIVVEYHSYPVIKRSLIARNRANVSGGGAYCPFHSGADFEDCTIVYNRAGSNAGGAYCHYGGPQKLNHCIIAFNSAPQGGGLYGLPLNYSSSTTYNYCDIFSNSGGDYAGNIKSPSTFAGNTSTNPMFVLPALDEFHLIPKSPCTKIGAYPLEPATKIERISSIKKLSDGMKIILSGKIVSAVNPTVTTVQEPDHSASIQVRGLSGQKPGNLLTSLSGTVATDKKGTKLIKSATCSIHNCKTISSK